MKKTLDEFYNSLAIESGINDIRVIKQFYQGFVRLFNQELHRKAFLVLPDIGEFKVKEMGKTGGHMLNGRVVEPYKVVKFVLDYKLKKQIKYW